MKFIVDKEINLSTNHQGTPNDLLHTKCYADILLQSVKDAPKGEPYTIGLFGEWGSGKSSVIKTMAESVPLDVELKKTKVVYYDAWKYSGDSFRRMFLYELRNALGVGESPLMQRFYVNETNETEIKTSLNWKKLSIVCIFVVLSFIAVWIIDKLLGKEVAIPSTIALVALLFSLCSYIFDQLKVSVNKPLLFAPEQFEECYKEMVGCATRWDRYKETALKWITLGLHHEQYLRLVIVVDNIDRCQADKAYTLLTDIKNFLCKEFDVIFVVPVDIEALRKHIIKSSLDHQSLEADEFLRKFFNTSIWMKPYQNDEMFNFANNIAKRNGLDFNPDTISLVANEFATNPRRIIQLYNNLQVELSHYDAAFAKEHQALIAKLLIIREEFPVFYRYLVRDPKKLFADPLVLKTRKQENLIPFEEMIVKDARLFTFLTASAGISSRYSDRKDIVAKILVNTEIGSSISEELRQAYRSVNVDAMTTASQDENIRLRLIDYLQDNIRKSVSRSTLQSDGFLHLRVLLGLFSKGLLKDDDKLRLMQPLDSSTTLNIIVKLFKNKEQLILFGKDLERLKSSSLSASLVGYFKEMDDMTEKYSTDDTHNLFFAASVWDTDQCKEIAKKFALAFEKDPVSCRAYKYDWEKNPILFSDDVYDHIFKNLKAEDCAEESSAFQSFAYLGSIQAVTKERLLSYIEKAKEVAPSFDHSKPDDNVAANFLDVVGETFNNLGYLGRVVPLNIMQQLFDRVNHSHQVTSNSGYRQSTVVHSFVRDKAGDEKCAKIVESFFINSNFIADGPVVSNAEIEQFIKTESNREGILNSLSYMNSNGIDVSTWSKAIITTPERNDTRRVTLLQSAFVQKDDEGQYKVDDYTVKAELSALIGAVLNQQEASENIEEMLDQILPDERIDRFTREILAQKGLDELKLLPKELMKRAISSFETNADNLSIPGDATVLQLLASLGSAEGRALVWGKVNPILADGGKQSTATITSAIQILQSFSELTKDQAAALVANVKTLPAGKIADDKKNEVMDFLKGLKRKS